MKALTRSLIAASLLIASASYAEDVTTAGQALSICKAQAEIAHADHKRSILKKVRQNRNGYQVKLKILTNEGAVSTVCDVTKEGEVTYTKS